MFVVWYGTAMISSVVRMDVEEIQSGLLGNEHIDEKLEDES